MPGEPIRIALLDRHQKFFAAADLGDHEVPGDEGEVGEGALVADEVAAAAQGGVEHAEHALDLGAVARDG